MTREIDGPHCQIHDAPHRPCAPDATAPDERRPCAGWVRGADGHLRLRAGDILAHVVPGRDDDGAAVWRGQVGAGDADRAAFVFAVIWERDEDAALVAAEDALLAVRDAITRAVGR